VSEFCQALGGYLLAEALRRSNCRRFRMNDIRARNEKTGSVATARCIDFVTDDCTSTSVTLSFVDHDFNR
jgi:hypothetical protein